MTLPAETPARIGRFDIEAVLGRGAMGVVYRARDPVIERTVAIKLVRADLLEAEERAEYFARFRREAQAAGRCSHPNIVAVYDFAAHDGNPYLAMEFVDGVSLDRSELRPGQVPFARIVEIGGQVLDGLAAAHAAGVIHRDIKPANIMLTRQNLVKIADFGISRVDTSQMTEVGAVIGTPAYMSPEQCRGEALDGRADLFSVAVVLYELLTGRKPFQGRSAPEIWHRLMNEAPPDPGSLRPGAPAGLLAAIDGGLAKSPAARFASAGAMAEALRGAAQDRTVVQSRGVAGAGPGLDAETVMVLERDLARHIGPIAPLVMRSAIERSGNADALLEALAGQIDREADRDQFRAKARRSLSGSLSGVTTRSSVTDADRARAQTALARFIGPIAGLLVQRAAPGCADAPELWARLSEHLPEAERSAFREML